MADSIIRAINNPREIAEMGKNGREKVGKKFTIEKVAEQYQLLYEEIVKPVREYRK
jgi:glycosyltransferase involved in cell wall biosynthesis